MENKDDNKRNKVKQNKLRETPPVRMKRLLHTVREAGKGPKVLIEVDLLHSKGLKEFL